MVWRTNREMHDYYRTLQVEVGSKETKAHADHSTHQVASLKYKDASLASKQLSRTATSQFDQHNLTPEVVSLSATDAFGIGTCPNHVLDEIPDLSCAEPHQL